MDTHLVGPNFLKSLIPKHKKSCLKLKLQKIVFPLTRLKQFCLIIDSKQLYFKFSFGRLFFKEKRRICKISTKNIHFQVLCDFLKTKTLPLEQPNWRIFWN